MRRGIVTAAAIAAARSLWLPLIVDRTISMHRGRPMRTRTVFSLVLSLLLFAGGEAFAAERRVALVIGNSSYIHAPALDNPVNDVTAVSVMLKERASRWSRRETISTTRQCAGRSASSRR